MENLLKVGVIVAVIRIENKCVKMLLPNKKVVDILPEIFGEIKKWLQTSKDAPESGGVISMARQKIFLWKGYRIHIY